MNLQALRARHLPAGSLGGGEGCGSRRGAGPGRAVRGGCAGRCRRCARPAPPPDFPHPCSAPNFPWDQRGVFPGGALASSTYGL